MLDREYEQLLTQFSRELERLQLKHQEELGKRVMGNIIYEIKIGKKFTCLAIPNSNCISLWITVEKQHQYGKEID